MIVPLPDCTVTVAVAEMVGSDTLVALTCTVPA
jgi:hypothetical protein